jgi:DNA gyrase subunit A
MATNIPPHNVTEICDAVQHLIDHWETPDAVTLDDLMAFVRGPDFPTGGVIVGREGIIQAYATGRGRIVVRARTKIEETTDGRHRIVVTEIPYQLNKTTVLERIAELVRSDRLTSISDLRDESDRRGLSVIIELKQGTQPRKALNRLFKYTPLQTTFGAQMLALVDDEPQLLSLKRALQRYVEHRRDVLIRRSRYELQRAQHRAHILEGLLIALDHLDAVIQTIRQSRDASTARERLMGRFTLTEVQAEAILDMPLRRLAALGRHKIEDEYAELTDSIDHLQDLLASPHKILELIRAEQDELKEEYGDERRTRIVGGDAEFEEEDLITEEDVFISITERGHIKRVPLDVYRTQRRGGRGVIGVDTREKDQVVHFFAAHTLDSILFFSDKGKVYQKRAYQIPSAGRTAEGDLLVGIINLDADEQVTSAVAVSNFEEESYLTMFTRQGRVKRTSLAEFEDVRPSGLIAIRLEPGDELGWVRLTQGGQELVVVTEQGQALRFREKDVRPVGRAAMGVYSIRLESGDRVVSACVVDPDADLLTITSKGYGKRTSLSEFRAQGRYTKGVLCFRGEGAGSVAAAAVVRPEDEIAFITTGGIALRTRAHEISRLGRRTRGVTVMDLKGGDEIASMAVLSDEQPDQEQ